jgi:hypothetical protein
MASSDGRSGSEQPVRVVDDSAADHSERGREGGQVVEVDAERVGRLGDDVGQASRPKRAAPLLLAVKARPGGGVQLDGCLAVDRVLGSLDAGRVGAAPSPSIRAMAASVPISLGTRISGRARTLSAPASQAAW